MDMRSDFIVERGIRCRCCGKKYLGNYCLETFGNCPTCLIDDWEVIFHDGMKYTSQIEIIK